jgi:hypothetical protein
MILKIEPRPREVIAYELSRVKDLDEAAELATELERTLENEQKTDAAKSA